MIKREFFQKGWQGLDQVATLVRQGAPWRFKARQVAQRARLGAPGSRALARQGAPLRTPGDPWGPQTGPPWKFQQKILGKSRNFWGIFPEFFAFFPMSISSL